MIERIVASVLLKYYAQSEPIKSMRAQYPQWLNGWDADLQELIASVISTYLPEETPENTTLILLMSACRQDILLNEVWFRIAEENL